MIGSVQVTSVSVDEDKWTVNAGNNDMFRPFLCSTGKVRRGASPMLVQSMMTHLVSQSLHHEAVKVYCSCVRQVLS